jgi:putative methyltransferase (TIGR04325 family)
MIIWKKVKKDFIKKNSSNEFNSKKWLLIISKRLKTNFNIVKNKKYLNQFIASSPLPIMLLNENSNNIKIADFGSGSQEIFFQLSLMKIKKKINIDSIEVEGLVNFFKKQKFNKKKIKISFLIKFNFKKKYDYVHISDSLQYVYDWENFLKKINIGNHKFIILNNVPAGKNKSYVTKQKFYGKEIPNIFFSSSQICKYLNNFELIYNSLFLNKINGVYRSYPQDNFEKRDRIDYPKTLVFKNKTIKI